MGLNKKVALSGGAVVAILVAIGIRSYFRYERSADKRELDQIQSDYAKDSAERTRRMEELRAKIATIKTGLKACDTIMPFLRTPPKCRDAKASSEITKMVSATIDAAGKEAKSAMDMEKMCQATLDKIIELSVDRGCEL
jgi:hypothetical protein